MVRFRQPLVVPEKVQKRFVRGLEGGIRAANDVADAARQNAVGIGARGHDASNQIILDVEDLVGVEYAFVRFDPQMCSRDRVSQLHRDAQPGASLSDAAVDLSRCTRPLS